MHASPQEIGQASTPQIASAIERVRAGNITVEPGYDGVFGVVKVFVGNEDRGRVDWADYRLIDTKHPPMRRMFLKCYLRRFAAFRFLAGLRFAGLRFLAAFLFFAIYISPFFLKIAAHL